LAIAGAEDKAKKNAAARSVSRRDLQHGKSVGISDFTLRMEHVLYFLELFR
jgi:hypothetical protein